VVAMNDEEYDFDLSGLRKIFSLTNQVKDNKEISALMNGIDRPEVLRFLNKMKGRSAVAIYTDKSTPCPLPKNYKGCYFKGGFLNEITEEGISFAGNQNISFWIPHQNVLDVIANSNLKQTGNDNYIFEFSTGDRVRMPLVIHYDPASAYIRTINDNKLDLEHGAPLFLLNVQKVYAGMQFSIGYVLKNDDDYVLKKDD
jgi:hypothetical protein